MTHARRFSLFFALFALLAAFAASAQGVFQTVTGDVRAASGGAPPTPVTSGQRIVGPTTITTGERSQTIVRFDDGQSVLLSANTEFRVNDYRFDRELPQNDNIAMQLFKGAMRTVTGLIASRNQSRFALVIPQATLGIRGTDFMVAIENPAYLQVTQGSIAATNAAGTAVFSAGATATVATAATLATAIPASALPASVQATFSQMSAVTMAAAGATAASSAAVGGLGVGAIAAGAAILGVAITAAAGKSESTTPEAASGTTAGASSSSSSTGTTGTQ